MPIFFTKAGTFLVFFPVLGEDLGVFSSRTRAYPLFFVFFLHCFTLIAQLLVHHGVVGEGFCRKPFTLAASETDGLKARREVEK